MQTVKLRRRQWRRYVLCAFVRRGVRVLGLYQRDDPTTVAKPVDDMDETLFAAVV